MRVASEARHRFRRHSGLQYSLRCRKRRHSRRTPRPLRDSAALCPFRGILRRFFMRHIATRIRVDLVISRLIVLCGVDEAALGGG